MTLWRHLQNGQVNTDTCSSVFVPAVATQDVVSGPGDGLSTSQWVLRKQLFIETCALMEEQVTLVRC